MRSINFLHINLLTYLDVPFEGTSSNVDVELNAQKAETHSYFSAN